VKSTHRINVLGREILVRNSASAKDVQEVEAYVNKRISEVAVSLPNADQQLVSLLTLLNITESYLALQRGEPSGSDDLQETADRILSKIDMTLGEETPRRVDI
jgi:cell division protein ZapA